MRLVRAVGKTSCPAGTRVITCEEFQEQLPAVRLNLVRERGLERLCLSCYDPEEERMHKKCRWRTRSEMNCAKSRKVQE
jgi:hypothetical protein